MHRKAIIFDLDNTIYSVQSIGESLFHPLFELITKNENHVADMDKIKADLMRRPFLLVAKQYQFSKELIAEATQLLHHHRYTSPIQPYPDYQFTRQLKLDRFLVTTGFRKLQQSKIDSLNISADFKEIHIVDPSVSPETKKDVFAGIMTRCNFHCTEILVVGDDLESEIKAAGELGIDAVLYDHDDIHQTRPGVQKIKSMEELKRFI